MAFVAAERAYCRRIREVMRDDAVAQARARFLAEVHAAEAAARPTEREVTGCADCPLVAEGAWSTCSLDPELREVRTSELVPALGIRGAYVARPSAAPPPAWCPLRAAPVTLRLRREREDLVGVLDEVRAELEARGTPIDGPALRAAITEDDEG